MVRAPRRKPRVVDLFSGAGGFSLGFQAAGAHIQAAVDIDEAAGQTHEANWSKLQPDDPPVVLAGDEGNLEDVDLAKLVGKQPPDILIGGPPCQGFSRVGRAKLDSLSEEGFQGDPRNALYRRFLAAADLWKPRAVVMENVPGMLSVGGRNIADVVASELAKVGYRVGYALLNAARYGVPQFRERLFFVGVREDLNIRPNFPAATHRVQVPATYVRPFAETTLPLPFVLHYEIAIDLDQARLPAVTVSEALSDLPELRDHLSGPTTPPRGDFRKPLAYGDRARNAYARLMRKWPGLPAPRRIDDHAIRRTPRDYETFRRMKPGDRYPEAIEIAQARLTEELARLQASGTAPAVESTEFVELSRRFVPPYPLDSFRDKWRKLLPDQPSWTVPAHLSKDAYSHIHYDSEQARAISVREAARLQSFPDGFAFSGNMGDCYRQIGNAVPPLLSWAVAHEVLELLGFASVAPPWRTDSMKELAEKPSKAKRNKRHF